MALKSRFSSGGKPRKPGPAPQGGGRRSLLSRREGRLALVATALIIAVIASIPGPAGAPSLFGWDKLDHLSAFAALALLSRAGWPGRPRWAAAAVLFAYGIGIELLQASPLINRVASFSDLAANAVGIALGLAASLWLGRIARTVSWMPVRR